MTKNIPHFRAVIVITSLVVSGLGASADDYDYDRDIAPLLEQHCVQCHGPEKQKSRYRLDSFEALMTPGSSDEDPIVPHYPMQSPLMEYLLMPKSDEYAMPPEDEDPLSPEAILRIAHWIHQGAPSEAAQRASLPLGELLTPEQLLAVEHLRIRGAIIHKQGSNRASLFADLQHLAKPLTPEDLNQLKTLVADIEELRFTGHNISAHDIEAMGELPQLTRLDLRMSSADDAIIPVINQFQSLQYLNLFSTKITDTGLSQIKALSSGELFAGETSVTTAGLKAYKAHNPEVTVFGTVDLDAVLKITEMAKNNSTTFRPEQDGVSSVKSLDPIRQVSSSNIRHSFLVCGKTTAIIGENSEVIWETDGYARDGMVLENGNVLLSIQGEAREYVQGTQDVIWSYKLDPRNKELGTANRLPNGNTLLVERGVLPRLLEVNGAGEIEVEVPLQPETDNAHMQTRMARKLPNGNYLVPHLLAFKVKEYTPSGEVVNVFATDLPELGGREAENWPFTAILLPSGNTLVNLTHGNKTVEFAPDGSIAWLVDNEDVDDRFSDPCGGQRLPNGNTIICSYGQKDADKVKIFEITPDKEVVWEFFHPTIKAHEVHILTTNGKPVSPVLR
jgi:hypothetical protein